jgi:hypothetical protein
MNRRQFLHGAMAASGASLFAGPSDAQGTRTRLILLGTGGGPTPKKSVSAPAQVIVINGAAYVVDCGDGVARNCSRRRAAAGRAASSLLTSIPITTRFGNHRCWRGHPGWRRALTSGGHLRL